ncbi:MULTISPECIES: hypothetical protein [unclassified Arthrobacter]|uniref:hypothetical protein n=1 Tax=unclassified Arthrobacter TaxID=235627 RepID=UPI0033977434
MPELPDLRGQVCAADDLYFDAVSQVRLPGRSRGRVTLLGDAASCVSLVGDGSSLAMTGATTLAGALAGTPGDPTTASWPTPASAATSWPPRCSSPRPEPASPPATSPPAYSLADHRNPSLDRHHPEPFLF